MRKNKKGNKVKISTYEEYISIVKSLGYDLVNRYGEYCKLEVREDGKYVVYYTDTSYHGSSVFEESSKVKLSDDEYDVLVALLEIKEKIERVSYKQLGVFYETQEEYYRNLAEGHYRAAER